MSRGDDARSTYLTKNISSLSSDQGDQLSQSDHPTHTKDDHFERNDHFEEASQKTLNLSDEPPNSSPVIVWSSDKSSDKRVLSDETDESGESDQHLSVRIGDRVRYRGESSTLERVCGTKKLEVIAVNGDSATVKHSQWLVTQTVPLADLRRV
jgi:hypothetical protein